MESGQAWAELVSLTTDARELVDELHHTARRISWREVPVGEMLSVSEIPVDIRDDAVYPRLMVPSRIGSVRLRDTPPGGGIRRSWRWCVREGQFVLSMAKAHEGAYGAVPPECNGALIRDPIRAYDVDQETVCPAFFAELVHSRRFLEACQAATPRVNDGIFGHEPLDEQNFLSQTLPVPASLEDQEAVAVILRRLREREAELATLAAAIRDAPGTSLDSLDLDAQPDLRVLARAG